MNYNKTYKPTPTETNILQKKLPTMKELSILISKLKRFYIMSNQNYIIFKSLILKQDEIDYTIFHILIGKQVPNNIITYDYFDLMAIHLIYNWTILNNKEKPEINTLFNFLDSL